ncbi:MAG: geranylgeranyl diphosphate reductase [Geminicoccaceae bacterium]
MDASNDFDVIVVGGGPAGATAATDLAKAGRAVLLLDRAGRIKPCGGAIPPRLIDQFDVPGSQLVARVNAARMISPRAAKGTIPIKDGFVGMVDREHFDEWLRVRAVAAGAARRDGTFEALTRDEGGVRVHYRPKGADRKAPLATVRAKAVIGADGARSAGGRHEIDGAERVPCVFAYHEIIRSPQPSPDVFDRRRCDVIYQGNLSPDFYAWVFPHGDTTSIGVGSAVKGFSLRDAVGRLREQGGFEQAETVRCEGAPIPLKPLKRWDNGRDILLAGDAAGVVAPASGEGIFYAMTGGRLAAEAMDAFCRTGDVRELRTARRRFMRVHGPVFWILGMMQRYWYTDDNRRERFVSICRDRDVQELTFDAYMNKELVKARPLAHVRIFFKNLAHLSGVVPA